MSQADRVILAQARFPQGPNPRHPPTLKGEVPINPNGKVSCQHLFPKGSVPCVFTSREPEVNGADGWDLQEDT